jgi:twitching motility protein PilI
MDNFVSLREFQERITHRLKSKDSYDLSHLHLGIYSDGKNYLFDMQDIGEILPLKTLTRTPKSKDWFMGVANIRGELYGIIDYFLFKNKKEINQSKANRILLIHKKHQLNTGLFVEKIVGLKDIADWEVSDHANLIFKDKDGTQWQKIDIIELIKLDEFLKIKVA